MLEERRRLAGEQLITVDKCHEMRDPLDDIQSGATATHKAARRVPLVTGPVVASGASSRLSSRGDELPVVWLLTNAITPISSTAVPARLSACAGIHSGSPSSEPRSVAHSALKLRLGVVIRQRTAEHLQ